MPTAVTVFALSLLAADAGPATETTETTELSATAEQDRRLFARPTPGPNAVTIRTAFPVPDYSLALGYDRALGRRFSAGGAFEYTLPNAGYAHLVGFAETINGRVWIGRPLHGIFGEVSLTAAHQVLSGAASLSRTLLAPGAALGFRYTLASGLSAGVAGGLRWGTMVARQPLLCTHAEYCGATREGPVARVTVDLGWVF